MSQGLKKNPYLARLADCLGMELTHKAGSYVIGHQQKVADFGLGPFPMNLTIVSSFVSDTSAILLVSVSGNLVLAATMNKASTTGPSLLLLDETKMQHNPTALLEHLGRQAETSLEDILKPAIVRKYQQLMGQWVAA